MTRAALERRLLDLLAEPGPAPFVVVEAPRGMGKSRLLQRLAARLAGRGAVPVEAAIDRMSASPEEIAFQMVRCVDRSLELAGVPSFAPGSLPEDLARRIREAIDSPRPDAAALLDNALEYPAAAAAQAGRPVTLVLDELGEVAGLSRHAGLRRLALIVARALAGPSGGPVLAAVSPASRPGGLLSRCAEQAVDAGRPFVEARLEPWTDEEMADFLFERAGHPLSSGAVESWGRATAGRPLYASILARRAFGAPRRELAEALAEEMTAEDATLHRECRLDFHLLVERSRGKAVVRSILSLVARAGQVNLTSVARHAHTSLPTAMDYLSWMMEVGLLRRELRSYRLADPLLGMWLRLNGPEKADPLEEALRVLQGEAAETNADRGRRPASPEPRVSSILLPQASPSPPVLDKGGAPVPGGDFLMEID